MRAPGPILGGWVGAPGSILGVGVGGGRGGCYPGGLGGGSRFDPGGGGGVGAPGSVPRTWRKHRRQVTDRSPELGVKRCGGGLYCLWREGTWRGTLLSMVRSRAVRVSWPNSLTALPLSSRPGEGWTGLENALRGCLPCSEPHSPHKTHSILCRCLMGPRHD